MNFWGLMIIVCLKVSLLSTFSFWAPVWTGPWPWMEMLLVCWAPVVTGICWRGVRDSGVPDWAFASFEEGRDLLPFVVDPSEDGGDPCCCPPLRSCVDLFLLCFLATLAVLEGSLELVDELSSLESELPPPRWTSCCWKRLKNREEMRGLFRDHGGPWRGYLPVDASAWMSEQWLCHGVSHLNHKRAVESGLSFLGAGRDVEWVRDLYLSCRHPRFSCPVGDRTIGTWTVWWPWKRQAEWWTSWRP